MSASTHEIRNKSFSGLASLGMVGLVSKLVGLLGGVMIARLLAPDDYGIFAIVGFLIGITRILTDIGLGVSIIQNREEPDSAHISSIFYFQNSMVALSIGVLLLTLPFLPRIYPAFRPEYRLLVFVLAVDFFLSSVKSIPQAVLSRRAEFRDIAIIEFIEQLAYWGVAIGMAWLHFGVWALATAVVVRSCLSSILFFRKLAWRPRLEFRFAHVRKHLRFSIEYQLARIFYFAGESITPTLISQYFGLVAVGYTSWAMTLTRFPQFVVFALHRATMSWFSRIQDEFPSLKADLLSTIELSCLIMFPMMAALFVFSHEIIIYIFSEKWLPAERILKIYSVNFALIAASYPLYTATFSLGHMRFLLFKGIGLTLLEFSVTIALKGFGFEAVAVAQSASIVASLLAYLGILWVTQGALINVFTPILKYSLITSLASALIFGLRPYMVPGILTWVILCGAFGIAYLGLNLLMNRVALFQALRIALIQSRIRLPGLEALIAK